MGLRNVFPEPPGARKMNNLDASIVALLKRNARISVTQMSHELGVSRVTINSHIKKKESSGVITGYTATLGAEEFQHNVSAWFLINVSDNGEEDIISQMIVMPEVSCLLPQTGGGTSRPKSRHQQSKPFMSRSKGCGRSRASGKAILACC